MHFPSFNVWLAIYLAHDLAFLMLPVDVCVNFEDCGLIICYSGFKWPFFFVIYRPVYSYDRQTHTNLEINRRKSTNVWITKIFFFLHTALKQQDVACNNNTSHCTVLHSEEFCLVRSFLLALPGYCLVGFVIVIACYCSFLLLLLMLV